MGIENRSVFRRRRRREILFDGCGFVAGSVTSICSFVCECACLCDSCCQLVIPISDASHPAKIPLDDFGSINDLIKTPMMGIHDGLDHSGLASREALPDKLPNNYDRLQNYEVNAPSSTASTTEDVHGGPNRCSPAAEIPPMDDEANGEDRLPNFMDINSSSCEDLSLSLHSTRNDLTGTSTMDIHKQLSCSSFVSQMPAVYNEYNLDDRLLSFKGDTMSGHDLNYTDSESCKQLQLSLHFLLSDPVGTPRVDIHEPVDLFQMDLLIMKLMAMSCTFFKIIRNVSLPVNYNGIPN